MLKLRKTQNNENNDSREMVQDKKPIRKIKVSIVFIAVFVAIIIGLTLSAALGVFVYQKQVVEYREPLLKKLTLQRADIAAQNITVYLESLNEKIHFYSRSTAVLEGFSNENPDAFTEIDQALKNQLSGVLAIRFIKKDEAKLDLDNFPPLRFSELDMIRNAERRKSVFPEAAKIEKKWIVNIVAPVPFEPEKKVAGVIFVSLDMKEFGKRLSQNNQDIGVINLLQSFDSNDQRVASAGSGGIGKKESVEIPDTHWKVEVVPSEELILKTHLDESKTFFLISVLGVGITAIMVVLGRRMGRNVERIRRSRPKTAGSSDDAESFTGQESYVDPMYQSTDILDIDLADEDEALLGLEDTPDIDTETETDLSDVFDTSEPRGVSTGNETNKNQADPRVPDVVFRAYDIRGIAGEQITEELAKKIGEALGSEAIDNHQDTLLVGRDARTHSPSLTDALIRGILSTGCNVLNIGTVPTPILYFATETVEETQSGVMVTASHNPAQYNGFKVVMNGKCRSEEDIKSIRSRILSNNIYRGAGEERKQEIIPSYIDTIFSDVALAGDMSIVIDAGNGVTGLVAPKLFEELGCTVTPLFCDLDGNFPNHPPDPSVESHLQPLVDKVLEVGADLGVAFDGDGDRLAIVTGSGQIIWPDRLLMLFAKDILARNPGADVVFDVKSTRQLNQCISACGGRPIMWKTGHSPMKHKMQETGALVGGEFSGHIFIKDRWFGFDDGLYAAARFIEIISLQEESLDQIFEEYPALPSTPEIRIAVTEEDKFVIIDRLIKNADFGSAKISNMDGIRADFAHGWGLIRASNTSAHLTLRFEAEDKQLIEKLKALFARELRKVDSNIDVSWSTKS